MKNEAENFEHTDSGGANRHIYSEDVRVTYATYRGAVTGPEGQVVYAVNVPDPRLFLYLMGLNSSQKYDFGRCEFVPFTSPVDAGAVDAMSTHLTGWLEGFCTGSGRDHKFAATDEGTLIMFYKEGDARLFADRFKAWDR